MIVITGAGGTLGGLVLDRLLERVPREQVAISVRDAATVERFAPRVARVVEADYADPASLPAAFEGAEQLLLVSANAPGPGQAAALHETAIDAATAAGVGRIVYTSHQAAGHDSAFGPMPGHARTQELLAASGVPHVVLRNGFYASSVPWLLGDAATTGRLVTPADGPVSWTAHADLADAAVAVLVGESQLDDPAPPLTAAEAVDMAQVAALLTELTGRPVEHVVAADEDWVAAQVAQGQPEGRARFTVGIFRAAREGEFDVVDPVLGSLIGRPPTPLRDVLAASLPTGG